MVWHTIFRQHVGMLTVGADAAGMPELLEARRREQQLPAFKEAYGNVTMHTVKRTSRGQEGCVLSGSLLITMHSCSGTRLPGGVQTVAFGKCCAHAPRKYLQAGRVHERCGLKYCTPSRSTPSSSTGELPQLLLSQAIKDPSGAAVS